MASVIRFSALALLACGSPASTPGNHTAPPPPDPGVADVDAFVQRWQTCIHFVNEEGDAPARKAQINDGIAANCPGNDETRDRLAAKYRDRPAVLARLRALSSDP